MGALETAVREEAQHYLSITSAFSLTIQQSFLPEEQGDLEAGQTIPEGQDQVGAEAGQSLSCALRET